MENKPCLYAFFGGRAKTFKNLSYGILGAIVISIGFGIYLLFEAGNITREDINIENTADISSKIDDEIMTTKKELYLLTERPKELIELQKEVELKTLEIERGFNEIIDSLKLKIEEEMDLGKIKSEAPRYLDVLKILGLEFPKYPEMIGIMYFPQINFTSENKTLAKKLLESESKWKEAFQTQFREYESLVKNSQPYIKAYAQYLETNASEKAKKLRETLENLEYDKNIVKVKLADRKLFGENQTLTKPLDSSFLIHTTITRFGSLLLVLFFSNLLANLYRYTSWLSGYYYARADAILLMEKDIDIEAFEKLSASLSPMQFDFSKSPNLSVNRAIELIRQQIRKENG